MIRIGFQNCIKCFDKLKLVKILINVIGIYFLLHLWLKKNKGKDNPHDVTNIPLETGLFLFIFILICEFAYFNYDTMRTNYNNVLPNPVQITTDGKSMEGSNTVTVKKSRGYEELTLNRESPYW